MSRLNICMYKVIVESKHLGNLPVLIRHAYRLKIIFYVHKKWYVRSWIQNSIMEKNTLAICSKVCLLILHHVKQVGYTFMYIQRKKALIVAAVMVQYKLSDVLELRSDVEVNIVNLTWGMGNILQRYLVATMNITAAAADQFPLTNHFICSCEKTCVYCLKSKLLPYLFFSLFKNKLQFFVLNSLISRNI